MSDRWFKNAIIYCLDVETFQDSDGDGVGDFVGLTKRLDYLAGLGLTCLWLMPFYPSPNRDNGYDVADYYGVDPRFGTLGDFVEFMREAEARGLRVIVDLVVNHTSDQHPWFQAARQGKDSPYYDYYVWSDEKPADAEEGMIFPGVQETTWSYDEQAQAYYFHRFFEFQPDLNIVNPAVRREIRKVMGFWLQLGVSGFRIDAAPFLIETKGVADGHKVDDPHGYLEDFREFLQWRTGDAIMLAEANEPPDKIPEYFGEGDRMHMLFDFLTNQQVFLALARKQAAPLARGLHNLPAIPDTCQWASFLRNHDELSLDKLSDQERQEVFAAFGPEERMQLYDRGIRRRLAPMFGGDQRRLELAYSLMFTLPGTPVTRYGDEIGMGDDLALDQRTAVRTPMQWSNDPNGGFSTASSEKLVRPVIASGKFGFKQVNVADQQLDRASLLNWFDRLFRVRKECPEIGWGEHTIIPTDQPSVFAHRCGWNEGTIIALHNLSDQPCVATLDLSEYEVGQMREIFGDQRYNAIDEQHRVEIAGYGYRWLRVDGLRRKGEY